MPSAPEPGQTLSHYRLIERIGVGGMGVVFRAVDTTLDRQVALKTLPPEVTSDPERLERFRREAKAAASLNHPNIVTIHSVEEAGGVHFMTLELVEGRTLDLLIPKEGLPLRRFFDFAVPLANAVSAAHAKGIIHRDLKPGNVMVTTEGIVKVLDFGLARLARSDAPAGADSLPTMTATRDGQILGTVPYMSPEQLQGRPVDHRSDIFSLGVILYEMASGRRPFTGESAAELASSILRDAPPALTEGRDHLPPLLGRVVRRCLEKDPGRRYQTALDVKNELEDLSAEMQAAGRPSQGSAQDAATAAPGEAGLPSPARSAPARAVTAGGDPPPPRLRGPRASVLAGAAAAAIAALIAAGFWSAARHTPPAPSPAAGAAAPTSVAILPFVNMSDDKENEYFSDGMTEELINALVQVRDLKVPARTTVFAYKGKSLDVQEIGRRLGVDTVLEGSVRRQGEKIRITAQLIKVADGYHLWSERYDRDLKDVFAIQDEIAQSIVRALRVTLAPGESPSAHAGMTTDVRAYDLYLRGLKLFNQTGRKNWGAARDLFQQALAIDPSYVKGWSGISWTAAFLYMYAGSAPADLGQAKSASAKALALAPDSADAHAARGLVLTLDHQYDDADREFATAVRLDPKSYEAHYFHARSAFAQGKLADAAREFQAALDVRPDDYQAESLLATVLNGLGRTQEVDEALRRSVAIIKAHLAVEPEDVRALYMGGAALVELGQVDEGLDWVRRAVAVDPTDPGTLYNAACAFSRAKHPDEALDYLEQSLRNGFAQKEWVQHDSDLDSLRDRPRFRQILATMTK